MKKELQKTDALDVLQKVKQEFDKKFTKWYEELSFDEKKAILIIEKGEPLATNLLNTNRDLDSGAELKTKSKVKAKKAKAKAKNNEKDNNIEAETSHIEGLLHSMQHLNNY